MANCFFILREHGILLQNSFQIMLKNLYKKVGMYSLDRLKNDLPLKQKEPGF